MKTNIYNKVTNLILEKLRQGVIPWRKSWVSYYPHNFISKKEYQGINFILLSSYDFPSHYFLTFKQAKKLGGNVLKGAHGLPVVFWKILNYTDAKIKEDSIEMKDKHFPFMKNSTVFNLSQTSLYREEKAKLKELPPRPKAKDLLQSLSFVPEIRNNKGKAYYTPAQNFISIPFKNQFESMDEYYATLFHEIIHSTGHKEKLNRFTQPDQFNHKSHAYSFEELIAEIGSSFLCAMCGIDNTLDNSASYIKGWLSKLQDDEKLIIKASTQAKNAVNFLLNKSNEVKKVA